MDGEAVYISFHKAVGDAVEKNDVVLEVESDKATIEVKAPSAGTVILEIFMYYLAFSVMKYSACIYLIVVSLCLRKRANFNRKKYLKSNNRYHQRVLCRRTRRDGRRT